MAAPDRWDPTADPAVLERVARSLTETLGPDAVQRDRPLAPLTTLKVGGNAAVFVVAADTDALAAVMAELATTTAAAVPLLVVGKGSNMLVSDSGFPGLALRLGSGFKWIRRTGDDVEAGAAEAMPALAAWAGNAGLAGLEFAAGVPASVGGSVRMNAGAHGGDVAAALVDVEIATPTGGIAQRTPASGLGLAYRTSALPERAVVTVARWHLTPDEPAAVRARLDELRAWRRNTQPIGERTCGSVFTNPPGGSAGRLVEEADLKGVAIGGARVSPMHGNFIEAGPEATATDVWRLVALMQARVAERGGPVLHPEVRAVGAFPEVDA